MTLNTRDRLSEYDRRKMIQWLSGIGFATWALLASGLALASAPWNQATDVQLAMTGDIGSEPMEYRIEMFSEGDARVTVVDRNEQTEHRPTIVVVAGQVMLVQDVELEQGYEIDALDGPVLMFQLVLTLLGHGVDGGPDGVPRNGVEVQHTEQNESIAVSTASAGGEFSAPWRLSGTVKREIDNRITYELDFWYTAGTEEATVEISGWWDSKEPRPELDPEMTLIGWDSFLIGPIKRQFSDSTIYDFGAQPRTFKASTLRELRQEISEQD